MEHIRESEKVIIVMAKERIEESLKNDNTYLDLKSLGLTSEDIAVLMPIIKQKLPHLESLNLEFNNLEYLPDNIIENLTNLRNLNLKDNNITVFPQYVLEKNPNLKINIANNNLVTIKENEEEYSEASNKAAVRAKNTGAPSLLRTSASVDDLILLMGSADSSYNSGTRKEGRGLPSNNHQGSNKKAKF